MKETMVRFCKNEACRNFRYEEKDCRLKEIDIGTDGECLSVEPIEEGKT